MYDCFSFPFCVIVLFCVYKHIDAHDFGWPLFVLHILRVFIFIDFSVRKKNSMSSTSNPTTTTPTTAQRRLMRDLRDLTQNPVEGINAAPVSADNIFQWNAILDGPEDSLFEDASFVLTLKFPQDYPNHPPDVKFVTKVFHPNICKI